jgi:flagellar biosynthetic protein FliO
MDSFRQLAAIGAVLGALLGALWWLRRRGWAGRHPVRTRKLECLDRLPLGPQHSLHLIRAGGRVMLISSSPAGCSLIGHLPAAGITAAQGGTR